MYVDAHQIHRCRFYVALQVTRQQGRVSLPGKPVNMVDLLCSELGEGMSLAPSGSALPEQLGGTRQ